MSKYTVGTLPKTAIPNNKVFSAEFSVTPAFGPQVWLNFVTTFGHREGLSASCNPLPLTTACELRDFLISLNLDQHVPKPIPALYQWLGRDGEAA